MPTYKYNPIPSAGQTTSPGQGHIDAQVQGFSQRTNVHQYDPARDVVGVLQSIKPQHYTTIWVTTNFKTSADMLPGQWIILTIMVTARDWKGLPVTKFYSRDIAIGNDIPGRDVAWQQLTVRFQGFPTQAQPIQVYIIRRAAILGGDFGNVPATQDLYVSYNTISYGGYSTDPSTFPSAGNAGGYGFGYGYNYGAEL